MPAARPAEAILRSIAKAERHIRSEYGTRMVGVMDTIGEHPHFAMMVRPGLVNVLSGREEIDAMYKASVELALPQASRILSQTVTDWYFFMENVPTRLWIEDGSMRTVQTVTLFVTDDAQGISGEYAWARHYPEPAKPSGDEIAMPGKALENLKRHEALLEAMRTGDSAAMIALLDPACIWATRNYLSEAKGGEVMDLREASAAADYMARWHAAMKPQHVSILNRKVADWFIFAEELWVVRPDGGEPRQCRTATIYAVDRQGRFEAALGAGLDPCDLSPSAGERRGRAFWQDPEFDMERPV